MSKKKKVKHSNIPLLLILLLITGACSIAAVYQYLKNRPAENVTAAPQNVRRESEKTSVSNGKQGSPDEKNSSSEKNNGAETTQVDPEVKPAENASLSDAISDTKQDNSKTEEASVSADP